MGSSKVKVSAIHSWQVIMLVEVVHILGDKALLIAKQCRACKLDLNSTV